MIIVEGNKGPDGSGPVFPGGKLAAGVLEFACGGQVKQWDGMTSVSQCTFGKAFAGDTAGQVKGSAILASTHQMCSYSVSPGERRRWLIPMEQMANTALWLLRREIKNPTQELADQVNAVMAEAMIASHNPTSAHTLLIGDDFDRGNLWSIYRHAVRGWAKLVGTDRILLGEKQLGEAIEASKALPSIKPGLAQVTYLTLQAHCYTCQVEAFLGRGQKDAAHAVLQDAFLVNDSLIERGVACYATVFDDIRDRHF